MCYSVNYGLLVNWRAAAGRLTERVAAQRILHESIDNTGQQNLTFFFGTRGKISNPNRTFNAEFKCVSSFSPSPTVCL